IKLQLPAGHPAAETCDRMIQAAEQMAEINGELLALGRRGHMAQEPVDVNLLVEQVSREVDAPPSLKLKIKLEPSLPAVMGSSAQLVRMIMNLVTNAREAMGDNGVLTIATKIRTLDTPLRGISTIPINEYVIVEVGDTGTGIEAVVREKMFD